MRVLLEVSSGADAGRKVRLAVGHELRIGRTEWADFSVPGDGQMSGVHFSLEFDDLACRVQDLNSSNGTFVNGQRIGAATALNNGDEILAGQTRFVVRVEVGESTAAVLPTAEIPGLGIGAVEPFPATGGPPPPAPQANAAPGAEVFPAAATPLEAAGQPTYTSEKCSSGLTLCRGEVAEIAPEDLATRLCQAMPLYLIVDFNNLGSPPPEDIGSPDYLFDWLDDDTAALVSPIVLSQTDFLGWPDLVKQGWGADSVVCLCSKLEKPALLGHLRRVIRAKPNRDDMKGGIIGFCWPGVMSMLLGHNTPAFVQRLLAGIDAVLVEFPDLPETWQLYGDEQVCGTLDQLGFVHKPSQKAADGPPENDQSIAT